MAKDTMKPCVKCAAVDRNTRGDCRPCARAGMRAWKAAHPKAFHGGVAAWKKAHPAQVSAHGRAWRAANPDKKRLNQASHMLKRNYGLTRAEYDRMYAEQGGVCAICGEPETVVDRTGTRTRPLSVDHCHRTDQVRGLLCAACNSGIGQLKDSPLLLVAAILYLRPRPAILEAIIALLVGWLRTLTPQNQAKNS
jgi:hypothetical protein